MKYISLFLLFSFFYISSFAQDKGEIRRSNLAFQNKTFNLGATIGFNSIFPIVESITIDDVEAENIRLIYKVGVQASVFGRINMDHFFVQPNLSWQHSEGDIYFDVPITGSSVQSTATEATIRSAHLKMSKQSLRVPVYIGYHIVREGPYALSFLAGPTLKYNYSVTYESLSTDIVHEYISESSPFGLNMGMGISVQIWQLFFDFSYEFGLNETGSNFRNRQGNSLLSNNKVQINKHTNVMSFSLGIIF